MPAPIRTVLVALMLLMVPASMPAAAFVLGPQPDNRLHFTLALGSTPFLDLDGFVTNFDTVAEAALSVWNFVGVGPAEDHQFFSSTRAGALPRCSPDGVNVVAFASTNCGLPWGDLAAIAQRWVLSGRTVQVDVLFNSNLRWNLYLGSDRSPFGVYDLGRIAQHEFGHAQGLDHEDRVASIMASRAGDFPPLLQPDDIAGAHAVDWPPRLAVFVAGFYGLVLGRTPTAEELREWVAFMRRSPAAANTIVAGFFHSGEYLNRPITVAGHMQTLYRVVLQREASAAEISAWMPLVLSRFNVLVPGFVNSPEFRDLLTRTPASLVITRLYQQTLGRSPSSAEVAAWVNEVARSGDWTHIAIGFLNSAEYVGTPRSLAEHIAVLYRTFLGRQPSAPEVLA